MVGLSAFVQAIKFLKWESFNWLWRSVSKTRWLPDLLKVLTWPMFLCQRIMIMDWLTAALNIPKYKSPWKDIIEEGGFTCSAVLCPGRQWKSCQISSLETAIKTESLRRCLSWAGYNGVGLLDHSPFPSLLQGSLILVLGEGRLKRREKGKIPASTHNTCGAFAVVVLAVGTGTTMCFGAKGVLNASTPAVQPHLMPKGQHQGCLLPTTFSNMPSSPAQVI